MRPVTSSSKEEKKTESRSYPKKLFYRIQEVSKITGLKPYVLRYWETQFPTLAPEKDKSDQRRYRQPDIELILRIQDLLHRQKYTIAGARQLIQSERGGRSVVSDGSSQPVALPQPPTRQTQLRQIRAELCDILKQLNA
jgi:DNA-binding transcriptional MerR regulator